MRRGSALAVALAAALAVAAAADASKGRDDSAEVRVVRHGKIAIWTVHYRSHTGARRAAYVVLPRWYGPRMSRSSAASPPAARSVPCT